MKLTPGRTYTRAQLGREFGFQPGYMSRAGGMISRPAHNVLLLITHAGGARPNEYDDYWDGDDLVYTGRGKTGDQRRQGQNRDLGDNLRETYLFEPGDSEKLKLLGRVECVDEWTEWAPDSRGKKRTILRFQLRFKTESGAAKSGGRGGARKGVSATADPSRKPRSFDPGNAPKPPAPPGAKAKPEETQALHEKAVKGHHELLVSLSTWLEKEGWQKIEEIPSAFDLRATRQSDGTRVIFEAKTVRSGSEGARVRSAIAQLFEYRFFDGEDADQLCLVCDRPISNRRVRLLDSLGIAVIWRDGEEFKAGSVTTIAAK